jgi:hypothetical protein
MVEPVGFAASLITLLDLTRSVLDYIKNTYHAHKERRKIFDEVTSTQCLLAQLQDKSEKTKWGDSMKVLATPFGPLQQLETVLNKLEKGLNPCNNRLKTFGKALIWPFEKKETETILSSLERCKLLLTLALNRDLL